MRARLATIRLVLRCARFWLLYGRAARLPPHPRSIVVVQFGKLGDMVCTTPVFRAIKAHDASIRVIVVGDKTGRDVLAGSGDVDRYIVCGTDIEQVLQELKKEKPDAGITAGPSLRGFALLYLSGVPAVIAPRVEGGASSEGRLYKLLRRLGIAVPHRMGCYAPREYLRTLEPLGIAAADTAKHLAVAPEAREKIARFWLEHGLNGKFVAGISPAAGNRIKQWPPERFAAVADHLWAKGAAVVLLAGRNDRKEADAMLGALAPATRVIDTAGSLSMEELKALIGRLGLFISVDTGPMYIAEALGVPTVDIVGPVDEREQPPAGPLHAIVVPGRAKPELFVMNPYPRDPTEARRQVESITVEQVIEKVERMQSLEKIP